MALQLLAHFDVREDVLPNLPAQAETTAGGGGGAGAEGADGGRALGIPQQLWVPGGEGTVPTRTSPGLPTGQRPVVPDVLPPAWGGGKR